MLDVLEDTTAEFLWKWEARDLKTMPKPFKPAATALKKRLAEVCCGSGSYVMFAIRDLMCCAIR